MSARPGVVLFNPRNAANPKRVLPMSVLALAAVLGDGVPWAIVDANLEADPLQALDAALERTGARFLGITVMPGPQLAHAIAVSRTLRARRSGVEIVWGGYFPTQHWETVLRAPYVDWVLRGHSELAFRQFLLRRAAGDDVSPIAGLAYKDDAGTPRSNPLAPIPHPRDLPDFPYDRIDLAAYVRPTVLGERTLSHHSSYGCPFLCNFCAVVNMANGRWFPQPAERVAATARFFRERAGIDALEFFDNNFFVHEARCAEFGERILDLDLAWWGEARIDTLLKFADATWRTMARSGLRMVFMGAEAGSDAALARMNKGGTLTVDKTLELAGRMRDYRVIPEFSFVLGSPPDPEQDVEDTLRFIRRIKAVNPAAEIIMYMYTPVPLAGDLYDQAVALGFAFPDTLEGWIDPSWTEFSQRRSTTMPWLGDRVRRRVRDFERTLNARYPTTTNPRLRGWRAALLKAAGSWRWALGAYGLPLELAALQRLLRYQRPETTGF